MKFNLQKFITDALSVKLKDREKAEILGYLKELMLSEPVRVRPLPSPKFKFSHLFMPSVQLRLRPVPAFLIVTIMLSAGTAFAAESSLPGDILYPVKVSVNERVLSLTAISTESKADLDVKLAERRLEEAEKLAVKNRLNDEVQAKIEENFREHADRVADRIDRFQEENPAKAVEVSSNFQTSLEAHARILNNIGVSLGSKSEDRLNKLSEKVKEESEKNLKVRTTNKDKFESGSGASTKTAAEGKKKAARNKIDEVEDFISDRASELTEDDSQKAAFYVESAEEAYASGSAQLEAGRYAEAFLLFQKSHNVVQTAKLLVKAKVEFEEKRNNAVESVSPSPILQRLPEYKADKEDGEDETDEKGSREERPRVRINIGF